MKARRVTLLTAEIKPSSHYLATYSLLNILKSFTLNIPIQLMLITTMIRKNHQPC